MLTNTLVSHVSFPRRVRLRLAFGTFGTGHLPVIHRESASKDLYGVEEGKLLFFPDFFQQQIPIFLAFRRRIKIIETQQQSNILGYVFQ